MDPHKNPVLNDADQLLRLHVISAHFDKGTSANNATYAVVSIGRKNAQTLAHPLTGAKDGDKEILWNEHFAIEYEKGDENSVIKVEVFSKALLKDDLLGEFQLKLSDIDPPSAKKQKQKDSKSSKTNEGMAEVEAAKMHKEGKTEASTKNKDKDKDAKKKDAKEESWANAKPRDAPLLDKKGNKVGNIVIRLRREVKLFGDLHIDIKEASIDSAADAKALKCICKLATGFYETPLVEGKSGKGCTNFVWKSAAHDFEINKINNVFDIFIEAWRDDPANKKASPPVEEKKSTDKHNVPEKDKILAQNVSTSGTLVGQSRITLYDTRSKLAGPIPIFNTVDQKQVGTLRVEAKLKQDKNEKKK